ncbi:MAG: lysophospholipase L1-like esterase [Planctomycetota bacterium]|jgi:lysophospholipase L1-like esterase
MIDYLLYGAAGLAATFVVAELAARAYIKARNRWYIHQPFSRRHFTLATDALPQLPAEARFEANADGERGDPVPAHPEKVLRVLVAGGSAAECFLLDQDDTSSAALQRSLRAHAGVQRDVHVGNVARSLITCRKINAVLAKAVPQIRSLDVVVLMVGASDLVEWFEAKTPATIEEGPFALSYYMAEHPEGPFGWKPKTLALYQIARSLNVRVLRPIEVKKSAGASIAKHRAARAATKNLLIETPDPAPMLRAFETHLRELILTCRKSAKHVVIALQPWLDRDFTAEEAARIWNFGQGSPYRGALNAYYDINLVRKLMGEVEAVAARVADETGASKVDLRKAVPSDFEHYYDFLHHTPKGAQLVGAAVAETIAALGEG